MANENLNLLSARATKHFSPVDLVFACGYITLHPKLHLPIYETEYLHKTLQDLGFKWNPAVFKDSLV